MTDHLTETDRALCEALESCASEFEYDVAASHLAAQRIRELSRQLHAAEADADRLAEAIEGEFDAIAHGDGQHRAWLREHINQHFGPALAGHAARLIDG